MANLKGDIGSKDARADMKLEVVELQVNFRYAGRTFITDFVGAHGCLLVLVRVISFVCFVVAR